MAETQSLLANGAHEASPASHGSRAPETPFRARISAIATLTLGILGSSLLPLPYAFAKSGVLLGVVTMLVVAVCNTATCYWLLRASHATGHDSYEGVAEAIGGKRWKVATQVSLVVLLLGTMCGDCAVLHDAGLRTVHKLWLGSPPDWLLWSNGRVIEVMIVVLLVFPLCLLRRMRSLEAAAYAGSVVVVSIIVIIVGDCWRADFPAIRDGDLRVWDMRWTPDLPEAFAVLGFSFYVQPILMPLLHEMPRGPVGIKLTQQASAIVVAGIAVVIYGFVGIFGAARYGHRTASDLLVNDWLGGKRLEGVLDAAVVGYLAISLPPIQLSLRLTLAKLIYGDDEEEETLDTGRHVLLTVCIVATSLGVALVFPTAAERIYAFTGATAVAMICYLLPVSLHLMLRRQTRNAVLPSESDDRVIGSPTLSQDSGFQESFLEVICPVAVCVVGVGLSLLALGPLVAALFTRQVPSESS
mmetsp:Transcript_4826/g.13876  ORF Transcript_4826/g.13876 Transcript_4826/m.13876 type:complete len:470 (+) Transcript_4826:249-1658(+)